jgi:hypothetical protein
MAGEPRMSGKRRRTVVVERFSGREHNVSKAERAQRERAQDNRGRRAEREGQKAMARHNGSAVLSLDDRR